MLPIGDRGGLTCLAVALLVNTKIPEEAWPAARARQKTPNFVADLFNNADFAKITGESPSILVFA